MSVNKNWKPTAFSYCDDSYIQHRKNLLEMLEFTKNVLTKVSFDRFLFAKELKKAVKWLNKEDLHQLRVWCQQRFGAIYGDVINETFAGAAV